MRIKNKVIMLTLGLIIMTGTTGCPTPTNVPTPSDSAYPSTVPSDDMNGTAYAHPYPTASGTPYPQQATSSVNPSDITGGSPLTAASPLNEENKTQNNSFKDYGSNPFVNASQDHLSTFSIDVDTASYTWMRKSLLNNILVDKSSVRTEEYINFFDYNYPKPDNNKFSINTDLATSRLNSNKLLRVGIQGKAIDEANRKDAVLTFVIDVSGSMEQENRLGLVKQSLNLLLNHLNQNDKVGIVIFGTEARVLLEPTSIYSKADIIKAIDSLATEGSTNTEAGLRLGYKAAEKTFKSGAINRIILCSDGVANVGETGPEAILEKIKQETEAGITLSTIGFGMGNYNDTLMETLADKGDGNYAYVDTIKEAERIFVQNLTGTLQVIAKDTKIQVDFNPELVSEYRLLGYENRDIADTNFRNDQVDAGEVGSNQSVTALYELKLKDNVSSGKVANVYLRYKDVDNLNSVLEMNKAVDLKDIQDFDKTTDSFKLAVSVAEYAELLKGGYWAKDDSFNNVLSLAKQVNLSLKQPDKVNEFVSLINKAITLQAK